jgi:hypothetical protein
VFSCLRFHVRASLSAHGGQSVRWPWTVCEEPADRVFVVFFASSCVASFQSILFGAFGSSKIVGQSAR